MLDNILMIFLIGLSFLLSVNGSLTPSSSLIRHFQVQIKTKAYFKPAFNLPVAAAKPILHLNLSLYGEEDMKVTYEAIMHHEESLKKYNEEDQFQYILCGGQQNAKTARSEIAKYDSGRLSIAFASRRANAACWRASLTSKDADTLAESPAFFHVSQVPGPAKFAPELISTGSDGEIVPSWQAINKGLIVRLDRGLNFAKRTKFSQRVQSNSFGLLSQDHMSSFFPLSEKNNVNSWKSSHSNIKDINCHNLVHALFTKETEFSDYLFHIKFEKLSKNQDNEVNSCVLSTLVYLASQNEVVNIEAIPSFQLHALIPNKVDDVLPKAKVPLDIRSKITTKETDSESSATTMNTVSTTSLQSGDENEPNPFWDLGINGTGQFVEVADTGFDDASCFLREVGSASVLTGDFNGDVQVARSTYDAPVTDKSLRKVVQYLMRDSAEADYGYDYASGHGTHCAGTVAGVIPNDGSELDPNGDAYSNCGDYVSLCDTYWCSTCGDEAGKCDTTCGFAPTETYPGTAPGAQLMVYDFGDASGALDVPTYLSTNVFAPAYNEGARIFSNSWGASAPYNYYDAQGVDLDEYIYDENDAFVLFAAGNSGTDYGDDVLGTGDASVGSPGICKNILTVGAAETSYTPDTVADFSSRGPSKDMRLKPEVVGPGDPVISTDASGSAGLASCGATSKSGTSMATPAVAGTAALIRQILTEGWHNVWSPSGFADSSYSETAPSAALMKAILIGSTAQMTSGYDSSGASVTLADFYGASTAVADSVAYALGTTTVDFTQGFGHVRVSNVFSLDSSFDTFLYEDSLEEYSTWTKFLEITDTTTEIDVTLVWTDPPGSTYCGYYFEEGTSTDNCLVHDLDLKVYNGNTRIYSNFGAGDGDYSEEEDTDNNAEKVTIDTSKLTTGTLLTVRVETNGLSYADTQKFAVVVTGNLQTASPVFAPTPAPTSTMTPTTPGGYCVSGSSSVKLLAVDRSTLEMPLSEVKVGDKILAQNIKGHQVYTPILGLPHSPSVDPYIEIEMHAPKKALKSPHHLRATLSHTFPTCHGGVVEAHQLSLGDCLLTIDGERRVARKTKMKPSKKDDTYSVVVNENIEAIAVGGVFTHARNGLSRHHIVKASKHVENHKTSSSSFTHAPGGKVSINDAKSKVKN